MCKAAKRTDVHSYGSIVPSDYELVMMFDVTPHVEYLGVEGYPEFYRAMREKHATLRRDPKFFQGGTGGCCVCGQTNYLTGAIFRHIPTGELVEMGWMCAEKVELAIDLGELARFRAFRKAQTLAFRARAEKRARLRAFVAEHATDGLLDDLRVDHYIIQDIRRKAQYGLSEKQVALVRKLAKEERERAPEPEAAPIPASLLDGRQTVTGTILTIKHVDSDYGPQNKMLLQVETDGGAFKLWGTAPAALYDECERIFDGGVEGGYWKAIRGWTVSFVARFERSRDDASFGFWQRPSKLTLHRPA